MIDITHKHDDFDMRDLAKEVNEYERRAFADRNSPIYLRRVQFNSLVSHMYSVMMNLQAPINPEDLPNSEDVTLYGRPLWIKD